MAFVTKLNLSLYLFLAQNNHHMDVCSGGGGGDDDGRNRNGSGIRNLARDLIS